MYTVRGILFILWLVTTSWSIKRDDLRVSFNNIYVNSVLYAIFAGIVELLGR